MKYLSVKEYANLIGKSNKTVYKMIDEGFVAATKEGKALKVAVDTNILKKYDASMEYIEEILKELVQLKKRVSELESQKKVSAKKSVIKKKAPVKKLKKAPLKKSVTNKKPLKKTTKKVVKKLTKPAKKIVKK